MVKTAAYRGRLSPAADARHQRRDDQRPRACDRDRGPGERAVRRRALRSARFPAVARLRRAAGELAGSDRAIHRRAGRRCARRRAALCHRRQWRDLLRPRRHRAQPGLDHGHGHGQPRHGDRQHRPQRRRREPAARPEQRAGRLRHGLVPARVHRLSPRLRRRDARSCSSRRGASASIPSRACASPTCSTARSKARSRASMCRARTSPSPIPTPST